MVQDERFELPTNLDSQSSALSIELILYISCGSCAPYLAPSCALFNSVPPRVPQECSFLSIQDLAVDSRFPLITRACQRWKWLHQHFHGKHQLQRLVYPSGFEPLTDCLEGSCAILLSHGYIYLFLLALIHSLIKNIRAPASIIIKTIAG